MNHTPGPWVVRDTSNEHYPNQPISIQTEQVAIATMHRPAQQLHRIRTPTESEQEANARLIAAAPDLLAALKAALAAGVIDSGLGEPDKARAAIAKAEEQ